MFKNYLLYYFKNYLLYYSVGVTFINQNVKDFDCIGLDVYRYFHLKYSIFNVDKTRLPAIKVEFILFGFGFEFCTHYRN